MLINDVKITMHTRLIFTSYYVNSRDAAVGACTSIANPTNIMKTEMRVHLGQWISVTKNDKQPGPTHNDTCKPQAQQAVLIYAHPLSCLKT